ncbi:uncharacterized protein Fot_06998 [Forsythia ovata]|uniref:DUF632 domain-containing protein n=1 Tax=Forsythia ovata TaxID=205694 RepID=A0ABD1WUJ4_9LAMI
MQRATYEYLRGNILDVFPEYKKDAEDHLSKAKRKSPMQRATYEYLRGNILDVFPEYKKDAEDHLSKARYAHEPKIIATYVPNVGRNRHRRFLFTLSGFPVLGSSSVKWSSFGKFCEDPIRNNVGCVGIDGSSSNCSTVGKLYAWEKKLYQEVNVLEFRDFEVRA